MLWRYLIVFQVTKKSLILSKQIAAILKAPHISFEVKHVNVQSQIGGSDCALFAMKVYYSYLA